MKFSGSLIASYTHGLLLVLTLCQLFALFESCQATPLPQPAGSGSKKPPASKKVKFPVSIEYIKFQSAEQTSVSKSDAAKLPDAIHSLIQRAVSLGYKKPSAVEVTLNRAKGTPMLRSDRKIVAFKISANGINDLAGAISLDGKAGYIFTASPDTDYTPHTYLYRSDKPNESHLILGRLPGEKEKYEPGLSPIAE